MKFFHRIRTQFRKKELDQELSEELAFHIQKETQENIASGMSAEDAHYAALRKFGGIDQVKEECRDAWGLRFIETLLQDLRFGLRMLAKNPGFTVVAVLTLALGIGANTAIFSVISGILLRKPPIRDPDGVVTVSCKNTIRGSDLQLASAPDFESWRERNHVFEDMAAAAADDPFTLTGGREPETVLGDRVTANYFSVLGVFPALGRAFLPSEGQAGHERVVILSYALWRERYDSSAGVIGKQLELNAEPYTVIGVMPPGTDMAFFAPRLWTPLVLKPHDLSVPARQNRYLNIFARLKPSVKIRNARAEMDSIAGQFARDHPETDKGWSATVLTLQEFLIRAANVRRGLVLLMVTVSFVLLIACANIAGLLLAREQHAGVKWPFDPPLEPAGRA